MESSSPTNMEACFLLFAKFQSFIISLSPRNYPHDFGLKLTQLFPELVSNKAGLPQLPEQVPPGELTFSQMEFDDPWQDADVVGTIHWLRGGNSLTIPNEWRPLLPKKL